MKALAISLVLAGGASEPLFDPSLICLSEAIFWEARGEPLEGKYAVAEVVMSRVRSKRFPNTVCGVVHQPSRNPNRPKACAFSFSCAKKDRIIPKKEIYTWDQSVIIASQFLGGPPPTDFSKGATHYTTCKVRPRVTWAKGLKITAEIGNHCFME